PIGNLLPPRHASKPRKRRGPVIDHKQHPDSDEQHPGHHTAAVQLQWPHRKSTTSKPRLARHTAPLPHHSQHKKRRCHTQGITGQHHGPLHNRPSRRNGQDRPHHRPRTKPRQPVDRTEPENRHDIRPPRHPALPPAKKRQRPPATNDVDDPERDDDSTRNRDEQIPVPVKKRAHQRRPRPQRHQRGTQPTKENPGPREETNRRTESVREERGQQQRTTRTEKRQRSTRKRSHISDTQPRSLLSYGDPIPHSGDQHPKGCDPQSTPTSFSDYSSNIWRTASSLRPTTARSSAVIMGR